MTTGQWQTLNPVTAKEGDTEQDSSIIQTRTRILFGDQEAEEICAEVTTITGN